MSAVVNFEVVVEDDKPVATPPLFPADGVHDFRAGGVGVERDEGNGEGGEMGAVVANEICGGRVGHEREMVLKQGSEVVVRMSGGWLHRRVTQWYNIINRTAWISSRRPTTCKLQICRTRFRAWRGGR